MTSSAELRAIVGTKMMKERLAYSFPACRGDPRRLYELYRHRLEHIVSNVYDKEPLSDTARRRYINIFVDWLSALHKDYKWYGKPVTSDTVAEFVCDNFTYAFADVAMVGVGVPAKHDDLFIGAAVEVLMPEEPGTKKYDFFTFFLQAAYAPEIKQVINDPLKFRRILESFDSHDLEYTEFMKRWDETSVVTEPIIAVPHKTEKETEDMTTSQANQAETKNNDVQGSLTALLGMQATAWKDAAVHRGGEVVNAAIVETALKAAPGTLRLWIGSDKPSNWKRHVFKVVASSIAAAAARWTGNTRFQRLANAALVAAWTDAMRILPIEEWIRTFLNSDEVAKAEALLNGEVQVDSQTAKIDRLTAQLAALTALVETQNSDGRKS